MDSLFDESTPQPRPRGQRTLLRGVAFGAFVGAPMGAVTGAACCWLTGLIDFVWHGVLIGGLVGPFAGAIVGVRERKTRGDLVRADIATITGVFFGTLPALLVLLQGVGIVQGRFSGYALMAAAFVGPLIGLLLGAILDRAFEAILRRSWATALILIVTAITCCAGLVYGIDALAYGPDPKEVGRQVKGLILAEWQDKRGWRDAAIENLSLARTGRRTYRGFVDATLAGMPTRLGLEVVVEGRFIRWQLRPIGD